MVYVEQSEATHKTQGDNMALLFESTICSRCMGSGHYSYCYRYGTTCFKCHGQKYVLTKCGKVAQDYFLKLQTVTLADLKVGDVIKLDAMTHGGGMYSYRAPVISIEATDQTCTSGTTVDGITTMATYKYISVITDHPKYGKYNQMVFDNATFRLYPNKQENIDKALAFQSTLSKTGNVLKRGAKSCHK